MSDFAKDTNVPANDCISRQAVIDAIVNSPSKVQDENMPLTDQYDGAAFRQIEILGIIDTLPSAQPKGRWIEKEVFDNSSAVIDEWQSANCSVCNKYHTTPYMYYFDHFNFCPNCGAKMEVSE